MTGLNYGYKYRRLKKFNEGVSYADIIKKWVVRIKRNNRLTTIASFNTEKEAMQYYKNMK